MDIVTTVVIWVVLLLMVVAIGMATMKKKWYIVTTAKPEKLILSRKIWEWEVSGMATFRMENGARRIFNKRWILDIEEIIIPKKVNQADFINNLKNKGGDATEVK